MDKKTSMVNEDSIKFHWLKSENKLNELTDIFEELYNEYGTTTESFEVIMESNYFDCSDIDYAKIELLDGTEIGMIGYYRNKNYPEDMWLGWFGIKKEFRDKGYATASLYKWEKYIKDNFKNVKYFRIFIDEKFFSDLTTLYSYTGYTQEKEKFIDIYDGNKAIIYSKTVSPDIPLKHWEKTDKW